MFLIMTTCVVGKTAGTCMSRSTIMKGPPPLVMSHCTGNYCTDRYKISNTQVRHPFIRVATILESPGISFCLKMSWESPGKSEKSPGKSEKVLATMIMTTYLLVILPKHAMFLSNIFVNLLRLHRHPLQ